MRFTPQEELSQRRARFQSVLQATGLDGALISQNADLFYFAGTIQTSHLFIPATGDPLLMTRKSFERARRESALAHVLPIQSLKELPGLLAAHGYAHLKHLGLEMDVLPVNSYLAYQKVLPGTRFADVSGAIRTVRAVKSPYEIGVLREAAVLLNTIFAAVPTLLEEGMSEVEFAGLLEAVARGEGHPGPIRMRYLNQENFYGHVLSGESGATPSFLDSPTGGIGLSPAMPQGAGRRQIQAGEPVLVDLVAIVDGLMVDQTRIFSLGPLPRMLQDAHLAMLQVQEAVIAAARPGVLCSDLYDLAVRKAAELGQAANFMGFNDERAAFVGHGVGLELNELPVLAKGFATPLAAGHVIALEPKCLFPGVGAVGIENTWLITETGAERLTFTPDDLVIL